MRILNGGELDPRITSDPRLSGSQRDALKKAAEADPDARVIGLDGRMRPVITAELGYGARSQYALLRNGNPASPEKPYAEQW